MQAENDNSELTDYGKLSASLAFDDGFYAEFPDQMASTKRGNSVLRCSTGKKRERSGKTSAPTSENVLNENPAPFG